MALIKCTECGKEFSDKAPACPNCGCPTSEIVKTQPGGFNAEAEKQMLALVEDTLAKARKAGVDFELASDVVRKMADSTTIDLLGGSARRDTSRIVEAAVDACNSLYTSYQGLIPTLDGACRPLLAKNPGAKAIKAVAGTMAWLNEESEIENSYAITFNGSNLGNAVKAKYLPSPANQGIQGFWEGEFYRFPDRTEAEIFWKRIREEHINKAARAEMDARQKVRDNEKACREWERQQAEEKKKKKEEEEEARKKHQSSQYDKIRERMEYARPAKAMFSCDYYGGANAYIDDRGKPTLYGGVSIKQKNYNPDDISKMADLCQIAVNNNGIFGLTRAGRVLMNSSTDYVKRCYGYNVISSWRDIKKISCTNDCLVGLCYDGTCVATKYKTDSHSYYGEGDVEGWRDIVDIVCGSSYTAGLKKDGTVCCCGKVDAEWVDLNRCRKWRDIVLLCADHCQLIGLKKDGTLVQTGNWDLSLVSTAKDIVDITVCDRKLFVLQSDGHVIGIKEDLVEGKKDGALVPKLDHVVALFRYKWDELVVLNESGELLKKATRSFYAPPETIAKLSWNYAAYQKAERERIKKKEDQIRAEREAREAAEREKREKERLHAERRAKNLCQHCGGELEKKLFGWKCKSCGQRKDY